MNIDTKAIDMSPCKKVSSTLYCRVSGSYDNMSLVFNGLFVVKRKSVKQNRMSQEFQKIQEFFIFRSLFTSSQAFASWCDSESYRIDWCLNGN